MTTVTRSVRFEDFGPEDLEEVNDELFKAVVDADLRRTTKTGAGFPPELSEALRGPAVSERWRAELERMLVSVNGQIAAEINSHEARLADLRRAILLKEAAVADAIDQGLSALVSGLERELHHLKVQAEELVADHNRGQARRARFRSGVEEGLIEARSLTLHSGTEALAAGIRAHRQGLLEEEIEPNGFDLALWNLLASEVP